MTLVMLAAAGGQDDLLRLLIKKGAQVNGRQKNGTTALIHAAEKVGTAKSWPYSMKHSQVLFGVEPCLQC